MTLIQPHQLRWIERNLIDHDIPFVVIGGVAVKFYHPARDTGDVDLFVGAEPSTISRLVAAIPKLSADQNARAQLLDRRVAHFKVEGLYKIDVLTFAPGLEIEEAVSTAEIFEVDSVPIPIVSRRLLIAHKLAVNEPKDMEDVKLLQ
ncbi:nucleotidyltransferase [Roseinatronobacter alkalisoli]|uniref:Nucleotidyltransferase n=1 Tax=Roseinatronobacter alkalisoli TaxID=3028235 RepID=A0ABT5TFP4_9RHOB|nr:nucleotidyltransferase [Roseinatronobacter sp. HJB301]MDD7973943.1 nucleotidyltransferase [Roseinatronobacter sp. HJB301]